MEFNLLSAPGYWMIPATDINAASYQHHLGGVCRLAGAVSPYTTRPFAQLARIDCSDPKLPLQQTGLPFISLLFSGDSEYLSGSFIYKLHPQKIEIISFLSDGYISPIAFSGFSQEIAIDLVALSDAEQARISHLNQPENADDAVNTPSGQMTSDEPRHQLLGEPFRLYSDRIPPRCPECNALMGFLAAFGDENCVNSGGLWGDPYVQVIYEICMACHIVKVNQFAD